jgi:catechol 2,3-dioxygenase-like lactoylglutathione lyase family enzyme
MILGHIHINVKDLSGATAWMNRILGKAAGFQNPRMASYDFENISLVFDQSEVDSEISLALKASDCDQTFSELIQKGGIQIDEPQDQPWGVRTAYIQGPGAITIELEQVIK